MTRKIIYHPGIKSDVEDAVEYYENKLPGLGKSFFEEFKAGILQIADYPFAFPSRIPYCREHKMA